MQPYSLKYNCIQCVTALSQHWNDCSRAASDMLGPQNAFFGFYGALEQHSGVFWLTFATAASVNQQDNSILAKRQMFCGCDCNCGPSSLPPGLCKRFTFYLWADGLETSIRSSCILLSHAAVLLPILSFYSFNNDDNLETVTADTFLTVTNYFS